MSELHLLLVQIKKEPKGANLNTNIYIFTIYQSLFFTNDSQNDFNENNFILYNLKARSDHISMSRVQPGGAANSPS